MSGNRRDAFADKNGKLIAAYAWISGYCGKEFPCDGVVIYSVIYSIIYSIISLFCFMDIQEDRLSHQP